MSIGDGTQPINRQIGEFAINLPEDMLVDSETDLIDFVYNNISDNYMDADWIASRSIVCPTNNGVDELNNRIMQAFPGEEVIYRSQDSIEASEHQW